MVNGINRYVFLDTNIVSKSIRKPSVILEGRMESEWVGGTRYLLSVVVVHELERSVLGSENPQRRANALTHS
jgi:predicted nucleic acid-binding protein